MGIIRDFFKVRGIYWNPYTQMLEISRGWAIFVTVCMGVLILIARFAG